MISSGGQFSENDTQDMKASTGVASDDVGGKYLNLCSSVLF